MHCLFIFLTVFFLVSCNEKDIGVKVINASSQSIDSLKVGISYSRNTIVFHNVLPEQITEVKYIDIEKIPQTERGVEGGFHVTLYFDTAQIFGGVGYFEHSLPKNSRSLLVKIVERERYWKKDTILVIKGGLFESFEMD